MAAQRWAYLAKLSSLIGGNQACEYKSFLKHSYSVAYNNSIHTYLSSLLNSKCLTDKHEMSELNWTKLVKISYLKKIGIHKPVRFLDWGLDTRVANWSPLIQVGPTLLSCSDPIGMFSLAWPMTSLTNLWFFTGSHGLIEFSLVYNESDEHLLVNVIKAKVKWSSESQQVVSHW